MNSTVKHHKTEVKTRSMAENHQKYPADESNIQDIWYSNGQQQNKKWIYFISSKKYKTVLKVWVRHRDSQWWQSVFEKEIIDLKNIIKINSVGSKSRLHTAQEKDWTGR